MSLSTLFEVFESSASKTTLLLAVLLVI